MTQIERLYCELSIANAQLAFLLCDAAHRDQYRDDYEDTYYQILFRAAGAKQVITKLDYPKGPATPFRISYKAFKSLK